ncbi:hypothetical protein VQ7734_04026 [Vibrio quintilis]|uniref:Uncharacterized protein n=2 Tax=Vibrio quintilis TaxID=1117707 RepID=A0A1M7Z0B7_9VIBR|nr:hypothetical protein VQ7734_04026 [Vibrio quintilis]
MAAMLCRLTETSIQQAGSSLNIESARLHEQYVFHPYPGWCLSERSISPAGNHQSNL